ncbi:MAG: hypothetical protein R3A80_04665 [Bdellovibrionota bacterium]
MRLFRNFLLLFVISLQAKAEDSFRPIDAHGNPVPVFRQQDKTTPLQLRRATLEKLVAERVCMLSFWTGKATAIERCMSSTLKQELADTPNLSEVVADLRTISAEDELQDKNNPKLLEALRTLADYTRSKIVTIEDLNIEELEASSNEEYAAINLNLAEIGLLEDINEAMTNNYGDTAPSKAFDQLEKDRDRIRDLKAENLELANKIRAKKAVKQGENPQPEAAPAKSALDVLSGY